MVGDSAEVLGAVCAGVEAAEVVSGVISTPVTLPLTASFLRLPVVPRALRVAARLAAAAAFCYFLLLPWLDARKPAMPPAVPVLVPAPAPEPTQFNQAAPNGGRSTKTTLKP